jgi:hypothetical protein
MQQQIEAICSSSGSSGNSFLAPSSWPTSRCLTSFNLECCVMTDMQPLVLLSAALQTVDLVELGLVFDGTHAADACDSLQQLPSLTNLTQLTVRQQGTERPAEEAQQLLAAAAQLSSLQRLGVSKGCDDEVVCYLPEGHLPHLTYLYLAGMRMDLASLSGAPAVVDLILDECTGVGSLTSLFAMTGLTSLYGPSIVQPPEDGAAAAPGAPAAWREGLQTLAWPGSASDATWPLVVAQLTALTQLNIADACLSPAFCR